MLERNNALDMEDPRINPKPSREEGDITLHENGDQFSVQIGGFSLMFDQEKYSNLTEEEKNKLLSLIKESQKAYSLTNETRQKIAEILN